MAVVPCGAVSTTVPDTVLVVTVLPIVGMLICSSFSRLGVGVVLASLSKVENVASLADDAID